MNEKQELALICVILVAAIIIIPVGISVLMHDEQPYRVVQGNIIEEAAEKAGLSICSEADTLWNVSGATGGKVYVISDDCSNPSETIRIEIQGFDSEKSRNAAITAFHSQKIGKARPAGSMLVVGQYLVFVDYSGTSVFGKLAKKLKEI